MDINNVASINKQLNQESSEQCQSNQPLVDESISSSPKLPQTTSTYFPWGLIAKVLAVIGSIGGLALHMMGFLSYQAYFTEWGIDPGLFPHSADAIIINGFYALADRTVAIFSVADKSTYLAVAAGLTVYIFVIFRAAALGKPYRGSWRPPEWGVDLIKSLMMTSIAMGIVPFAVIITVIVLITPAGLGEKAGRSLAEHQMKNYLAGCDQKNTKEKCIEIRKNGKPFAHGFLIESSESHIALFDVDKKQARAFEREGTELFVDAPHEELRIPKTTPLPSTRRAH